MAGHMSARPLLCSPPPAAQRSAHLHVGAAALHAHLANDGNGCVAQALVLFVGQRLRGGHGD